MNRLLCCLLLLVAGAAHADRFHLEGGGTIDTTSWWIDGDVVRYETEGGTMGIPRAVVVRIEKGDFGTGARFPNAEAEPQVRREKLPDRELQALMQKAFDAVKSREFEAASAMFLDILARVPEQQTARVGYAVSELALGHNGMALSVILDGLAREPEHAELNELLGDVRNREERVPDALDAWKRAFDSAPNDRLREKILKAERELSVGRDYDFAATSHFNVRYDGDVDRALAREVMEQLEKDYWELADLFSHAPEQPITVLLYPSREFRQVTHAPEWVAGIFDGKIRVPLAGLNSLTPQAEKVLRHELAHAFIHSKTRGQAPRWLHEGLAQIVEGRRISRADRQAIARQLASGAPEEWESRGFTYPMALSLTRYLEQRRSLDVLVWMLDVLGRGRGLDNALREVYGEDYAQICRRWSEQELGEERR